MKEHKGDAIDLYAKEGRLLKAKELKTGERNHVRNQYSGQENAPGDGPGGNGEGGLGSDGDNVKFKGRAKTVMK